jgi:tetratricopeptide (TPR) repeat protein
LIRYSQDDFDRAVADYSEAIRLDPKYAFAFGNRARTHRSLGNLDQAIADFNKSLEINPNNANDFNGRGVVYLDRQAYEKAIADFSEAIRLNPKFTLALSNRCRARAMIDDQMQQALADCDHALLLDRSDAWAIANRAFVYLRLGDPDKAITEYTIALQKDPKNAHALYGRGLAKRNKGDTIAADADIAAARAIRPNIGEAFTSHASNRESP